MRASFVIPMYNIEEEYLRECLDSLKSIKKKNIEFILIDDGSPDKCGEISEEYAASDERFRVYHKENGGVSSARNAGIEKSVGEYITFIDADDWVESAVMDRILDYLEKTEADILMFGQYIDFKGKPPLEIRPFPEDRFFDSRQDIEKIQKMVFVRGFDDIKTDCNAGVCCNAVDKFVKRDVIMRHHMCFDEHIAIGEDSVFFLELFGLCDQIQYVNLLAYHYRMRGTSANHHKKTLGYDSISQFFNASRQILEKQGRDESYYTALYYRCYDLIFEQFEPAYINNPSASIWKKAKLFSQEMKSEPFYTAIKTVQLKNLNPNERRRAILLKAHMGYIFILYKCIKKKTDTHEVDHFY